MTTSHFPAFLTATAASPGQKRPLQVIGGEGSERPFPLPPQKHIKMEMLGLEEGLDGCERLLDLVERPYIYTRRVSFDACQSASMGRTAGNHPDKSVVCNEYLSGFGSAAIDFQIWTPANHIK